MPLADYMKPLKDEIQNDPLVRGYAGMTDQQVADDLNAAYRSQEVSSFSGDFMFARTDPDEFAALPTDKQQLWVSFTSKASVDPWAANNVAFAEWVFGSGAQTITNLANERTEAITRAQEIGFTKDITAATVAAVRS